METRFVVGLNENDIEPLERTVLEMKQIKLCPKFMVVFLLFRCMRMSDVMRLKGFDFQNDRLHYTMGKNQKERFIEGARQRVRDSVNQDFKENTDKFGVP